MNALARARHEPNGMEMEQEGDQEGVQEGVQEGTRRILATKAKCQSRRAFYEASLRWVAVGGILAGNGCSAWKKCADMAE